LLSGNNIPLDGTIDQSESSIPQSRVIKMHNSVGKALKLRDQHDQQQHAITNHDIDL